MSPKAKHPESKLGMMSIVIFALSLIVAAHAGGSHATGGGHEAVSSGARDDDMPSHAFEDELATAGGSSSSESENSSSLDDKSGGFGFVLIPNCSPLYAAGGPGGSLLPFSGGAMGPVETCNPSDLSGPSQQAGQAQSLAEQDTSQPPTGSSSYIHGGSALSSPERPNDAGVFPNLYPPNTSQGSLYHSNGVGTSDARGDVPRSNNVVTNSSEGVTEVNPGP